MNPSARATFDVDTGRNPPTVMQRARMAKALGSIGNLLGKGEIVFRV